MKKALAVLFILITAGCSTPSWMVIGGTFSPPNRIYRVSLPQGWMKFKSDQYTLLTRDGLLLQSILIKEQSVQSPLPYSKQTITPTMPAADMAQLTIEEIKANPLHANVQVLENKTMTSNNRKGFYLRYTFTNPDGLVYQSAHCVIIGGNAVFHLIYMAPQRYYFTRDIKTFEAIVESFSLQPL